MTEGERTLDYASLWAQANAFAAALHDERFAPGDRVALILQNSIEAVVATYGTWLAGGVIVPLNAQAKARDFGPWLRHADARVVVHEAGHADAESAIASIARSAARDRDRRRRSGAWRSPMERNDRRRVCSTSKSTSTRMRSQ